LPGVPDDAKAVVFDYFRSLYTKLWDEDEGMMRDRQAYLDERTATRGRTRTIEIDGGRYAVAAVCPHLGGPLDRVQVEDGCLVCPWHGYRFDVRTGECVSGQALRLTVTELDTRG
jgi:nitrite reductase/ring-hydroxylating ferredoxin subunit